MTLSRHILRLLIAEYGHAAVARMVEEEAPEAPRPRRRRTQSADDAARRAAEGVPVDELAKARAKRAR